MTNQHPQIVIWRCKSKDCPKQIEFLGIPFIIMGKKKIDCTHGVDRNRSLKKKRLDEKAEKVYTYETTLILHYIK